MYRVEWLPRRPAILALLFITFILTACGAALTNENWPGLTAEGDLVFVSFGPGIVAVDIPERQVAWTFPENLEGRASIYAPLSILDGRIVVGDFGQAGGFFSPGATVTIYSLDGASGEVIGAPAEVWTNAEAASDKIVAQASQSAASGFIGTGDNFIIALNAENGQERWRFETGHSIWGQPVYLDGVVYAPSLDKSIYALDAETGAVIWQTTFDGSVASSPVIDDDTIYVGAYDHFLHALDRETGEIKWSSEAANLVWGAPALGGDNVYFADIDGNIFAVTRNGEAVWQQKAGGLVQTAPVFKDGVLYVVSGRLEGEDDELVGEVLALDASDGSEIWRTPAPAPILTSPVIVGDELVVAPLAHSSLLMVYKLEDGALAWSFDPPSND